jgi:hypothetical protein
MPAIRRGLDTPRRQGEVRSKQRRPRALDDPDLRKEAAGLGLQISPTSGVEVQALVANIYNAPPELLRKIRVALGYE